MPEASFSAEVVVTSDGGPYLSWLCRWWLDDEAPSDRALSDGALSEEGLSDGGLPDRSPWVVETGWWRVPPHDGDTSPHPVELLVADPSGHVAVYVGQVSGARIDLVSDLVARTETGADVTAGRRMLGLVDGELMWAFDLAAFGQPLQSYASARMTRVLNKSG
jgi:hypothetical protein